MKHTLPQLSYAYDTLEPHIDAKTMEIHHSKHHAAYVNNLNSALEKHPEIADTSLEDLLRNLNGISEDIRTAVRNNGGGHYNHSLFWTWMDPKGGGIPEGNLGQAINQKWENFEAFKKEFSEAAKSRFGSGWAWFVKDGTGALRVMSTANQDTPLSEGLIPLLGLDVWEHAYYLKYQNKRADYIEAWWNVVNWNEVALQFNSKSSLRF